MRLLKYFLIAISFIILLVFSISYIVWLGYPKTYLNVYVLDKTVPDFKYEKHRALFWVLNNSRIVKSNGKSYKKNYDYYGFHPLSPRSDYQYDIRRILLEQIDSISDVYDVAYYADTRGVYFNEWFKGFRRRGENSAIEGGLNQNDYLFLKSMKEKNKLIIGEFEILSYPTSDLICYKTELLFKVHATGWKGCYFSSLDSSNKNIPYDIIDKYKINHKGDWPFKGEGIILTNRDNIIVLENNKHLNIPHPVIVVEEDFRKKYDLPMYVEFTGWFEIIVPIDTPYIAANFQLNLTSQGDSICQANGLSSIFPAIIIDKLQPMRTCYFAGDFATTSSYNIFSQMANSRQLLRKLTSNKDKKFFQNFYFPLMESMLKSYSNEIKTNK